MADLSPRPRQEDEAFGEGRGPESKFSFQLPQLLAPESQTMDGLSDAFC